MARPMKDSSVSWIGYIPEAWSTIKLKYLFSLIGGNGFPDNLQGKTEGDYPFCKVSDINGETDYVNTASNWVSQSVVDDNRYNIVPTGSILMAKIGAALAKNHRKINTVPCCIDNNTQALVPKRENDIRYLFYLSKCIDMKWFDNNSTIPSINNTKLLNSFVPNTPLIEQKSISSFLDSECARIDEVIKQTHASIEEYKKLKQSIITEAVTKGIRKDRPMKDSGIEWVFDIPCDWITPKVLQCLQMPITDGPHTTPELFDDGIPFVSAEAVSTGNGHINFDHMRGYISQEFYEECCKKYIPQVDDVYMIKSGATTGRVAIVDTDRVFTIWSPLAVFRANKERVLPMFLFYCLQADYVQKQIENGWTYGTQQNIGMRTLEKIKLCVPPINEQIGIIEYLKEKISAINLLIEKKETLLAELENYKKSVIYEYITGKKEIV